MAKATAIKKAQQATHADSVVGNTTRAATRSTNRISSLIKELGTVVSTTYSDYINTLTPRLKLIDLFLVFLVALGILQFVYVILVGNFPFNAFLGGFISCVGQFVLIISLRLQIKSSSLKVAVRDASEKDDSDKEDSENVVIEDKEPLFEQVSPERAFGDFVFASLILHFIVYHFIN